MTVRSIIDIELNDGPFKEFMGLWERYQDQLKKTPGLLHEAGKGNEHLSAGFTSGIAALMAQNQLLHKQQDTTKDVEQRVRATGRVWQDMGKSTRLVANNIGEATKSLLKWVGIGSAIGALAGVGGSLWGIDRLAYGASQSRRSASGLGVSIGQEQAFQTNYNRLVDPSFLENLAEMKFDKTKRAPLLALGIDEGDIDKKSVTDLGAQVVDALKSYVEQYKNDPGMMGTAIEQFGLGGLLPGDVAQRLLQRSPGELAEYRKNYQKDAKDLDIADPIAKANEDFKTQMARAGKTMETALITALAPLTPKLTALSEDFTRIAVSLIKWVGKEGVIEGAADALQRFHDYVTSPAFIEDMKALGATIRDLATGIGRVARWLGKEFGDNSQEATPEDKVRAKWEYDKFLTDAQTPADRERAARESLRGRSIEHTDFRTGNKTWTAPILDAPAPGVAPADQRVYPDPSRFDLSGAHNPFGLRAPGQQVGFRGFRDEGEATKAASDQLLRDYNKHGQHTLREIIGGNAQHAGWAPASDGNDVDLYVKHLAEWTKSDPDADYDVNDTAKRAALLAGISRQEGRARLTPQQITVIINDSTGANISVQGAQLGVSR